MNNYGQLGNGTSGGDAELNVPARIGSDKDWASVSAGGGHTTAIKTNYSIWAWGHNYNGELGDGTNTNRSKPVRIQKPSGN